MRPHPDPPLKTALQGAMGVLGLAALGLTVYQIVEDNGLFRLVSDIQAFILFGSYFPFISFLVTLFVCALPAVGVGLLKDAMYGPNEPPFPTSEGVPKDLVHVKVVQIADDIPPAPPHEKPPDDPPPTASAPPPEGPAAPVPPKAPPPHPGPPYFPS